MFIYIPAWHPHTFTKPNHIHSTPPRNTLTLPHNCCTPTQKHTLTQMNTLATPQKLKLQVWKAHSQPEPWEVKLVLLHWVFPTDGLCPGRGWGRGHVCLEGSWPKAPAPVRQAHGPSRHSAGTIYTVELSSDLSGDFLSKREREGKHTVLHKSSQKKYPRRSALS